MGTAPPEYFPPAIEKLEAAWAAAGREGRPRKMSLTYFSLADDPDAEVRRSIGAYYAFAGEYAEMLMAGAAKGEEEVKERVRAFEAVGCDELIMFPTSSDPGQVDRLAAAVL
jgi:alkanesulfonate monooxygenase SsuD/methylene tetrahydromethanopterin reductase-like flavin-dependent oxidoreductase (luciferase family)